MNPIDTDMTVPAMLRNVVKNIHPITHPFLIHYQDQSWKEISYHTAIAHIDAVSAYLLSIGIRKGDRAALLLENSPFYVYFDQGIQQIGVVNVSIYPTLPESDTEYILNDSGARTIIVNTPFLLRKILKIANNCPSLMRIIPTFDGYEKYTYSLKLTAGVIPFHKVIEEGKSLVYNFAKDIASAREGLLISDISTLIYTSGTTGTPKGVMLTHANLTNNVKGCLDQIPVVDQDDIFLSFLPLSHVFERTATYHVCLALGARIAFAQSIDLLAKNMYEVKPTVMCAVPRLLEKIHDKALKNGTEQGLIKARIFNWAVKTGKTVREKKERLKKINPILSAQHKLADKLVFGKIKEKTGGKLKFMISGGGALPQNVGEFFGNIGIKVLEGYGLTETSPVVAVTEFYRQVYGTVGRILPGIEVAIQHVDTLEIFTKQNHQSFDPSLNSEEGEIIIRGHCIMKGYWNKPEETQSVIDSDGWFHTGDIGKFYKGNLKITDRLKNMLVNAYGKNVYPTPVENTYLKSKRIEQIFLIGDKREYLTALIVPNQELLKETFNLRERYFTKENPFIEDVAILDWIEQDVKRLSNELAKFERIRSFKVKRTPFSIESGELTPTLKAKRKIIEQVYAQSINELYENH
ncbi:long-chain fatty acid--CoA ligase [Olivibacter sp. SDN3]|uniref:AMP-dependent synthetase/ligase n=1 Tax=Olivibacter sp. SDN3 TaxID=2764720 RepID=UPI001651742B|nr:long-chain fatty acid--CoA ligase [Olivibacter sp. SDN3]QNL48544.1 long-chain fatty acid--CoA ligase [Olivibacter sp. SDN3]